MVRWRNPVASILIWPSDWVEITVKTVMLCLFCWHSDRRWITVNPSFYWLAWGSLASVCLGWTFWFESHIHAWNMAWGWMAKEIFGSTIPWSRGTWKSHPGFWIFIVKESLFISVFLWALDSIICGLYGYDFMDIFVPVMLVTYIFSENNQ